MNAGVELLGRLRSRGLEVRAEGTRLWLGPRAALTDEIRAHVREHKAELLTALEQERQVRELLAEMRPALAPALRDISDDGLLRLAQLALRVAAERAIDARLARRR